MTAKKYYPFSHIKILPGDLLYSGMGKSTYFVGHIVIVGTDLHIKETLPTSPSGQSTSIEQYWQRHQPDDQIYLFRSNVGADQAAHWASEHVQKIKSYNIFNNHLNCLNENYCSKFIVQAYYYGANFSLIKSMNRLLLPQQLIRSHQLEKIALFNIC